MTHSGDIAHLIVELDDEAALALVKHELAAGTDPMALVAECSRGMQMVGEQYAEGTYYISGLIMAGDLLRKILSILAPRITGKPGESLGHDACLHSPGRHPRHWQGNRCQPAHRPRIEGHRPRRRRFASRVADEMDAHRPDIVGLSCLIALFEAAKHTVEAVRDHTPPGPHVPVILGGGTRDQEGMRIRRRGWLVLRRGGCRWPRARAAVPCPRSVPLMRLLIFSGFLGSGKTTLVLALAKRLAASGHRTCFMVNEMGEVGVDQRVMRDCGLDVREITSGCICCSLGSDLITERFKRSVNGCSRKWLSLSFRGGDSG